MTGTWTVTEEDGHTVYVNSTTGEKTTTKPHDFSDKPAGSEKKWQDIQKKTFTGWVNYHLKKRKFEIVDVEKDFSDGVLLINLLEQISNTSFGKYNNRKDPNTPIALRPHRLDNLAKCVKFLNDFCVQMKIKLSFSGEDICDGKGILGMLWIIILRFAINDVSEEELSAKEGLLLWCKKTLAPYKNIQMNNFTSSWQDGLAFNGLIHRFHPDWLDYDSLKKENAIANLNQAFNLADERLSIPKLMDAEDLVQYADEKSVMTYVSFFWKAFAASSKSTQAGRRIAKALTRKQALDNLKDTYSNRATDLLSWVSERTGFFSNQDFGTNYAETLGQLQSLNAYRSTDKSSKSAEKLQLEILLSNLQTQLANSSAKPFTPAAGQSTEDINASWKALEDVESQYETNLVAAIERNKKLDVCVKRIIQKHQLITRWGNEKNVYLAEEVVVDSLYLAQGLLKKHEAFADELQASEERVVSMKQLYDQIAALDPTNSALSLYDEVVSQREAIKAAAAQKEAQLKEQLAIQQQKENTLYALAKQAERFNLWGEDAMETLTAPVIADTIAAVEALQHELASFKSQYAQKSGELQSFFSESAATSSSNPYARFTSDQLSSLYQTVESNLNTRTAELDAEHSKQIHIDSLRKDFAEKAAALASFIHEVATEVKKIDGAFESQLKALDGVQARKDSGVHLLSAVQAAGAANANAGINENSYTKHTAEGLDGEWKQLGSSITEKRSTAEKEILLKQMGDVTPEQLQEFRDVFNHFDKDKTNTLTRHEFSACLQSFGEELTDAIWAKIDASGDNVVRFDEFVQFMSARVRDNESPAQVESFRVLSKDKDVVTEAELNSVLEPAQVAYLKSILPEKDGGYDYNAFLESFYQ